MHLNCGHRVLDLSTPQIMGIVNITPDSATTVGRFMHPEQALQHASKMMAEGATIIDVGAEATNPQLNPCISTQEELDRLLPALEILTRELDVLFSVDTSKPEVMTEAVKCGVNIINDVRALRMEGALSTVAKLNVPVCLMHMRYPYGKPSTTVAIQPDQNIIPEVKTFLQERITACMTAGIAADKIIIDPGIGHGNFGKNLQENLILLQRLSELRELGFPILVCASRKTFIGELLDLPIPARLTGSLAAAVVAVMNGASIIRVHDVKETAEAMRVVAAIKEIKT
jgi:dihydropteroate synthase